MLVMLTYVILMQCLHNCCRSHLLCYHATVILQIVLVYVSVNAKK